MKFSEISDLEILRHELIQQIGKVAREDIEILLCCLAIGHADHNTKKFAIYGLPLASVWRLIARDRLPLLLLYNIGLRFKRAESSEFQKIFCDCTRSRILEEIDNANDRKTVADLTKIVLLMLEFDFMVETVYFERFDELLTHFHSCVERAGLKIDYFEGIRAQLETARTERGSPTGSVPQNIRNLPLYIQRRLAGEAPYLMWFTGHPDPRIALETLRHISLGNIENVLRIPELNGHLLRELLKRREFFGRSGVLALALSHPKCSMEFARNYIPNLSRNRQGQIILSSLAKSGTANTAIRTMAQNLLSRLRKNTTSPLPTPPE